MFVRLTLPLAFFFTLCLIAAAGAKGLELVYPADKTAVSRSDFLIIKGGDAPPLEEMSVEINGVVSDPIDISSPEYRETFADLLILEPIWTAGKNTVVVKGFVDGKVVKTVKNEIYYSRLDDPVAIIPPGYKPFVMHVPDKEALCAPCHNMKPTAEQLRHVSNEVNPCASCHSRMFQQDFVHGPEGVFQCVDCHDSKGSPQRWQVLSEELTLCGECHTEKMDEIKTDKFVHGPVAAGNCTICHNPHAAAEPAQLNAPINKLCTGCHSDIREGDHVVRGVSGAGHPLSKKKDPQAPEKTMSCVSCHNPHGGVSASLFRGKVSGRFELCQNCHKK